MRPIAVLVFLAATFGASPAGAGHGQTYERKVEAVPCVLACPWVMDTLASCGVTCPPMEDPACGTTFPVPGTFADVEVTFPEDVKALEGTIAPVVDWDLYACDSGRRIDDFACIGKCTVGCDGPLGTGCQEAVLVTRAAVPDGTVTLRVFNVIDPEPVTVHWRFLG